MKKNKGKRWLNISHLQGFIVGILVMVIFVAIGFLIYNPGAAAEEETNLGGVLFQGNHYEMVENFQNEVLNASEQTLVYFNDLSIGFGYVENICNNIYENTGLTTKIYIADNTTHEFVESLGISRYDLPLFVMFENGKIQNSHKLDLQEVSVVQWVKDNSIKSPVIYRAFPSSAREDANYGTDDYYVSELCLLPDKPTIWKFIKMKDNATLPITGNHALYALLADNFGGDNRTYFGLPNLEEQIPITGLAYYMANQDHPYPSRGEEMPIPSYINGNIKYLEFSIEDISYDFFVGSIILAKNIDEEKYKDLLLPCDGQTLSSLYYPQLETIYGNKFGGVAGTSFNLPDLSNIEVPVEGAKYYVLLKGIYPASV